MYVIYRLNNFREKHQYSSFDVHKLFAIFNLVSLVSHCLVSHFPRKKPTDENKCRKR